MGDLNRARILVIDDDPGVRSITRAYLEKKGFTVVTAADGREGLFLLDQKSPDLLLCDVKMPSISGLEVLQTVKRKYPLLPVIMISGAGFINDVVDALRLGAWDYLLKPFPDLTILEHSVNQSLHRAKLERENSEYRERLEEINRDLENSLSILREDQEAGRQVQLHLLPENKCCFGDYVFSYIFIPSLYLSGDFLDYFVIDERHIGFYIADVSGHGSSSAFVTVLLKNLIGQAYRHYQTRAGDSLIVEPDSVIAYLNREIIHAGLGKHVTMIYGVLDMEVNLVRYCIAGHYPLPVATAVTRAYFIPGKGLPVGLFQEASYATEQIEIPPGFSCVPGMGANYQNARSLTELTAATVAERQGGTRKGKLKEAEGKPTTAGTRTDREAFHGRRAC